MRSKDLDFNSTVLYWQEPVNGQRYLLGGTAKLLDGSLEVKNVGVSFSMEYYDDESERCTSEFIIVDDEKCFKFKEIPEGADSEEVDDNFYELSTFESADSVILSYVDGDIAYHFHVEKL